MEQKPQAIKRKTENDHKSWKSSPGRTPKKTRKDEPPLRIQGNEIRPEGYTEPKQSIACKVCGEEWERKTFEKKLICPACGADNSPEVTFYGSGFASVCLPARTPRGEIWQRSNGRDTLLIESGIAPVVKKGKLARDQEGKVIYEKLLLPAGMIPRWLLLYMSHQYTAQKSNPVDFPNPRKIYLGRSLAEFLELIGVTKSGRSYKLVIEQVRRFLFCRIGLLKEHPEKLSYFPTRQLTDKAELWWDHVSPDQQSFMPSNVTISEEMKKILERSIPLNLDHVKTLGRNVLAFDIYTWLNVRHYSIFQPVTIQWLKLHRQLGSDYKELGNFKKKLLKVWEEVKKMYPHNSEITKHGILLKPSKPVIKPLLMSEEKKKYLTENFFKVETL